MREGRGAKSKKSEFAAVQIAVFEFVVEVGVVRVVQVYVWWGKDKEA